jgi:UPF0716 protein FxsA
MNPLIIFLLLFVGIPLFELYWLIEVGSLVGALPTLFLVVFTAVLGGLLVRLQGFSTALRVRETVNRGEVPALEMLEGALLLVSGFLLLLPGFFTDLIGFLLLVPPLRRWGVLAFLKRMEIIHPHPPQQPQQPQKDGQQRVIEGEYQREEDSSD